MKIQLLKPEKIQQQEQEVRILQGCTFGLYALSLTLGITPMLIDMDKVLNSAFLGLSVASAYAGAETANRLKGKEQTYCAAKTLQVKAIAKNLSAEWQAIEAITDAKTMQLRESLNPEQGHAHQPAIAHHQQQQLPQSNNQQQQGQPTQAEANQQQDQQQNQQQQLLPEPEYGPALVQSLAAQKAPVSFAGKLEGSAFDRYLLAKSGEGTTFKKVDGLSKEIQLDLRLKYEPIISIHEGCIAIDIPRQQRRIYRYEDYIKPGVLPDNEGLWLPIGISLGGQLIEVDLSQPETCHIMGGGITGSGKSVWMMTGARSFRDRYSPDRVKLVLCDFGKATFGKHFDNYPHLLHPVAREIDDIIRVLEDLVAEMKYRKDLLEEYGVPHVRALNRVLETPLPAIITFKDEYIAQIKDCTPDQRKRIETALTALALEGRKFAIHLLTFMQRPEEEYLDGQVRSNHPASICFYVPRPEDSKIVLGEGGLGGERLLGKGDLLFRRGGVCDRLQSLFWEPAADSQQPRPQQRPAQPRVEVVEDDEVEGGEFAYRYPANWKQISHETKMMTGGICCFPGCRNRATETHHAHYLRQVGDRLFNICDDPEPGVDLFGLCDEHHKNRANPQCAHHKNNWIYGTCEYPREIDSRNTDEYLRLLQQGWLEKTQKFEEFVIRKIQQEQEVAA